MQCTPAWSQCCSLGVHFWQIDTLLSFQGVLLISINNNWLGLLISFTIEKQHRFVSIKMFCSAEWISHRWRQKYQEIETFTEVDVSGACNQQLWIILNDSELADPQIATQNNSEQIRIILWTTLNASVMLSKFKRLNWFNLFIRKNNLFWIVFTDQTFSIENRSISIKLHTERVFFNLNSIYQTDFWKIEIFNLFN
jgi:hypothetical protein